LRKRDFFIIQHPYYNIAEQVKELILFKTIGYRNFQAQIRNITAQ